MASVTRKTYFCKKFYANLKQGVNKKGREAEGKQGTLKKGLLLKKKKSHFKNKLV